MPAHFIALTAVLIVDELEPTRAFFVDRLGFAVRSDVASESSTGFSVVERGGVAITLRSIANLRSDTGQDFVAGPYRAAIYVEVDDVEMLVPEVIDADVVLPLRRTAAGNHEIGIREPGGNIIVFASRVAH